MPIAPIGSSLASAGLTLTSASLLQQIGVQRNLASSGAIDTLRSVLQPVHENEEQRKSLSLSESAVLDLAKFMESEHAEPSEVLLQALSAKSVVLRTLVEPVHPELFVADATATPTGKLSRGLEYEGLTESARQQHAVLVHEAVDRLLTGIHERSRISQSAIPKAISLQEVLAHPEQFRDKPLEIALFDVDGTTHKGETFFEGQYSIEWLIRDVLRHGPSATSGLSWFTLLKAIPGIIKLRLEERAHKKGGPDRSLFAKTFEPILKGLDSKLAKESLERFYNRYGRRGVSQFMKAEFERHRQKNRLIIGVSASLETLVKMHAKDLGVPEENMLGTSVEVDDQGIATGKFRWLHGEEKVTALEELVFQPLRERGIQFKLVAGYSDSPSDKPMLGLVKQDGGVSYAMNASRDAFKAEVLADGGMAVDEEDGWLNDGVRHLTFASSESGRFVHEEKTAPFHPAWIGDLRHYAGRVFSDTAGVALAAPVSELVHNSLTHDGHAQVTAGLLSSMPSMAAGAFLASAVTTFLVPPDGPVSWWRRVVMRGMIPMAAAMVAAGNTSALAPTLASLFVASAGVEALTVGERVVGLRRWNGGDERKNPVGKTVGFWGLRSLQFSAYRALMFLFQRAAGA